MQVQIHPRSRYSAFPPNCSVLFFLLCLDLYYYVITVGRRECIGFTHFSMDHTAKKKRIKERELV